LIKDNKILIVLDRVEWYSLQGVTIDVCSLTIDSLVAVNILEYVIVLFALHFVPVVIDYVQRAGKIGG
jgi:hypothetical protein